MASYQILKQDHLLSVLVVEQVCSLSYSFVCLHSVSAFIFFFLTSEIVAYFPKHLESVPLCLNRKLAHFSTPMTYCFMYVSLILLNIQKDP